MSEWSREDRYQRYEDVSHEELHQLQEQVSASKYRQTFHIQPQTGLLNDPNGLIYFNGVYYLSHQWFPLGAVHGLKYWFNYTSKDLVHFEPQGPILKPDTVADSHGVYSGSAFEYNQQLYYMYTGNHRDDEWNRHSSQMIAKMNEDGTITKFPKPVISQPPQGYTQHFRDPKVFKHNESYYAIIGAQNEVLNGRALIYKSNDIVNWELLGDLTTQLTEFGYMWECPDYFNLDGFDMLLFAHKVLKHKEKNLTTSINQAI